MIIVLGGGLGPEQANGQHAASCTVPGLPSSPIPVTVGRAGGLELKDVERRIKPQLIELKLHLRQLEVSTEPDDLIAR